VAPTRNRIIRATIDVIVREGAAGVRVHEIAATCDITATTIYRYFGDRRGLVNAAQAERYRPVLGGFGTEFVERVVALRSQEEFRNFIATVWRWFLENPEFKMQRRQRAFLIGSSE
jgi:AcrR family transcriptional regulator